METRRGKCGSGRMIPFIVLTLALLFETTLAQNKPQPKAEIQQPLAGRVLSGKVNVQLKLPAKLSGPVYAGLGGPPWAELEQVGNSNEWYGKLNSRMVPNGNQKLIVKT